MVKIRTSAQETEDRSQPVHVCIHTLWRTPDGVGMEPFLRDVLAASLFSAAANICTSHFVVGKDVELFCKTLSLNVKIFIKRPCGRQLLKHLPASLWLLGRLRDSRSSAWRTRR